VWWKIYEILNKYLNFFQGIEAKFYYQSLFLEILSVILETQKKEKRKKKNQSLVYYC
jgi:hypothetical protein